MDVTESIKKKVLAIVEKMGVSTLEVLLEHPEVIDHGDYSTNIALVSAKFLGKRPREVAESIVSELQKNLPEYVERVEIAGPGFINFFLTRRFFVDGLSSILSTKDRFGRNNFLGGQKTIIEYTDPNPFKQFHIGHLMSNAIGESISRLIEFSGSDVVRMSYGGDVGLHVAKSILGVLSVPKDEVEKIKKLDEGEQLDFWAKAYVEGNNKYEEDSTSKEKIDNLNKTIFEKSDPDINSLYEWGREVSIKHFQHIFKKLDTNFDKNIWESDVLKDALTAVNSGLEKGILERSEGAVIFKGEKYGLHTRVFVNSKGVPTYEAKELGLNIKKHKEFSFDKSIVITGNEQNDYFKVLLKAIDLLTPEVAGKTVHVGHGMLRFTTGKMSSRKGNVITGESLISDTEDTIQEKISDRGFSDEEKKQIAEVVGIAAIKYSILKQAPGRDIIFDMDKSLSLDGDSGPYLQYAHTRACSVLEKAKKENIEVGFENITDGVTEIEKLLLRFPEVVESAMTERAPQHVSTYLTQLASAFNGYYAAYKIVDKDEKGSSYRLAVASAFEIVMKNGLWLLGIKAPERM